MGKILIIDDEKQMLALLSRILELEGYEVYRTATCKAGLRQLQVNTPEVVLRDVCLPDGNGIELIDRMKNISPSAEIILLTAHGKIEDSVSAIKSSAFDYLVKGDDNNRIFSLIAKEMEKATVIMISHRITSLMQADCIIVMDKGVIQQMGTHEELIHQEGPYKDIYEIQMNSDIRLMEGGAACE